MTDGALKVPVTYYPKSASLVFGGAASPLKAALQVWAHGLDSAQPPSYAAVQQGNPETTGRRPMQANGEGFPLGSPVIAGPHIGIDEAGKGDWFGPLVVAAVFLDEEQSKAMRETGVRDSKSLRPEVIQRLAAAMKVVIPVHQYHVLILSPETYNQEYERHKNINLLLAEMYAQAAQEVWRVTHSSKIVVISFHRGPTGWRAPSLRGICRLQSSSIMQNMLAQLWQRPHPCQCRFRRGNASTRRASG